MMLNVSATLSPSHNKDTRTQVREQLEKEHAGGSPSAIKKQLRAVYSPLSGSKNAPQGDNKTLLDMYADVGTPIGRFSLESGLGFDFSPSSGANHSVQSAITVDSPATAGSTSGVDHDDDGNLHQEEQEQQGEGPTSVPSPPLPSSGAVALTDDDAACSALLAISDMLDDVLPTLVVSPLPLNGGNNGFGGSDFWETSVIRELRDGPIFSTGGPYFNTTTTERLLLSDDDGDEPPFSGCYSAPGIDCNNDNNQQHQHQQKQQKPQWLEDEEDQVPMSGFEVIVDQVLKKAKTEMMTGVTRVVEDVLGNLSGDIHLELTKMKSAAGLKHGAVGAMEPVPPLTPPPPRSTTLPPRTPPSGISPLRQCSPASKNSLASAARGSVDPAFASPFAAPAAMAAATAADGCFSGGPPSPNFAAVAAAAAETIFLSAAGVFGDDDGDSATPTASATTPATTTGVTATVADEPIGVAAVPVSAGHDQVLPVVATAATMSAPTPLLSTTAVVTNLLAAATTSPPPMMPIDPSSSVTKNESVDASATGTTGFPDLSRNEEVLSPPTDACRGANNPEDAVASPTTSAAVSTSNNKGASTPPGVLAAARNLTTTPTPSAAPTSDAPAICPTPFPGGTAAVAGTSPPPASTVPLLVGTTATAAATAAVVVGAKSPSTPAVPLVLPSPGSTPKGIIERELKVDIALNPIVVRNSATTPTGSAAPTVDAPAIYPAHPPSGTAAAAAAGISPTPVFTVPLLAEITATAAAAAAAAGSSSTPTSTVPLAATTSPATTSAPVIVGVGSPSTLAVPPVHPSPRSAPVGIIERERRVGTASNTIAVPCHLVDTPTPYAAPAVDAPAICPATSPSGTATAAAAVTSPAPKSTVPLAGTAATTTATAAAGSFPTPRSAVPLLAGTTSTANAAAAAAGASQTSVSTVPLLAGTTPTATAAAAAAAGSSPTPRSAVPLLSETTATAAAAAAAAVTSPAPKSTVPLAGTAATTTKTATAAAGSFPTPRFSVPLLAGTTPTANAAAAAAAAAAAGASQTSVSTVSLLAGTTPTATAAAAAAAAAGSSPTPRSAVPLLAGTTPTAAAVAVAITGTSPTPKSTIPLVAKTTSTATTAAAVVVSARSPSASAMPPVLPSPGSAPKEAIERERRAGSASNTTTPSSSSEKEKQRPPMRFHDAATTMASPARPLPGYANAVEKGRFQSAGATAAAATDAAAATATTPLKPSSTNVQVTPARRASTDKGTASVPARSGGAAASRIGTSPPPTGAGANTNTTRASQGGGAVSPMPSGSSPVHTVSAASVRQRRSAGADRAAAVAAVFGAGSPLRYGGVLDMVASVGAPAVFSGTAAGPAFLRGSQLGSSSLDEVANTPAAAAAAAAVAVCGSTNAGTRLPLGARRLSGVSGVASPSRVGGVGPGAARSPFGSVLLNRATSASARAGGATAASSSSPVGRPAGFTLDKENPSTGGSHTERGAEKRLSTVPRTPAGGGKTMSMLAQAAEARKTTTSSSTQASNRRVSGREKKGAAAATAAATTCSSTRSGRTRSVLAASNQASVEPSTKEPPAPATTASTTRRSARIAAGLAKSRDKKTIDGIGRRCSSGRDGALSSATDKPRWR
ncbi:unnamed protein product [Ectocarpus sp. 4 AP-2014]